MLNVTATGAHRPVRRDGVAVRGATQPTASSLDPSASAPNAVVTAIGADGKVFVHGGGRGNLIADVNGFVPAGSAYEPSTRLASPTAGWP